MSRRRARPGEALAYLEEAVALETDDCQIWPFGQDGEGGYGSIFIDGRHQRVHVVACERAHGPMPQPGMLATHGPCHNRLCFNGRHLAWQTFAGNERDKVRDGTSNRGSRHALAKLDEPKVVEIKHLLEKGLSHQEIGNRFAVSRSAVTGIAIGRCWRHVA